MILIRKAHDRGHADHGWLDTYHTFSFAGYYDPEHMGFRDLRVINEDWVQAGQGFGTHPHRDMEIITYVLEGAIQHKDSMGNGSVIRPGDVQRMSAGRGVKHSEFNGSKEDSLHLMQIWILPAQEGGAPSYEQKHFSADEKRGKLRLIASQDGEEGSVKVQQDVKLYAGILEPGQKLKHALKTGRHAWVQLARGELKLNGKKLETGDGAAISSETELTFEGSKEAEILVFDLK